MLKNDLASWTAWLLLRALPVAGFFFAAYLFVSLILPTTPSGVWLVVAGACTALLVLDRVVGKDGGGT